MLSASPRQLLLTPMLPTVAAASASPVVAAACSSPALSVLSHGAKRSSTPSVSELGSAHAFKYRAHEAESSQSQPSPMVVLPLHTNHEGYDHEGYDVALCTLTEALFATLFEVAMSSARSSWRAAAAERAAMLYNVCFSVCVDYSVCRRVLCRLCWGDTRSCALIYTHLTHTHVCISHTTRPAPP